MAPENLAGPSVRGGFARGGEAAGGRRAHLGLRQYGLRLISTGEGRVRHVPSFGFYYLIRDLGEEIEDAEIQQVDGGERLVRYVTTMTDLPVLDIRDTIELGEFGGRADAVP